MSYRQVWVGAATAAVLVWGANAGSLNSKPSAAMLEMQASGLSKLGASAVVQFCGREMAPGATIVTALEACGGAALGEALDVFGATAARLKRL